VNALPGIETERLLLRGFRAGDAPSVQRLAGDRDVALNTLRIPHPYEPGMAEAWIAGHARDRELGKAVVFAVTLKHTGELVGSMGLEVRPEHDRAELGYWIGRPYWGKGYATEAAKAVVRFGFCNLRLNRLEAHHFTRNPASGRVLEKIGMRRESLRRQAVKKWGEYQDIIVYAMLREDFHA